MDDWFLFTKLDIYDINYHNPFIDLKPPS